ncbi:hybrid sensor histidine kinase/response regulator [Alkaliflexus imshenetskii]|uniref:hybrid sensor histidine kinase/response regulator n=1 Tax=Alkaliflexus imshenetskii TaxID=286730 RepID=UPI00047C9109|nr:hybrid sensor histidine kinase/response regulator [Alkaliflexus imshenetskii]
MALFNLNRNHKHKNQILSLFAAMMCLLLSPEANSLTITNISLTHFSANNKLPGESIQCIYQDKYGILWMGIESAGLTKYDGKTHTQYRNSPNDTSSISTNYPVSIIEDNLGFMWVATTDGLNKMNRFNGKFQRFRNEPNSNYSLSSNIINKLIKDKLGMIWIATSNGITILNPYKDEFIRLFNNPDPQTPAADNEIYALHMDRDGNMWIGSALLGLYMINQSTYLPVLKQWQSEPAENLQFPLKEVQRWDKALKHVNLQTIRTITSSNTDTIWIGSQNGLFRYLKRTDSFEHVRFSSPEQNHLNTCTYITLYIDSLNYLWAGSSNDGLVAINLNSNEVSYLNENAYATNQLKSNAIRDIMQTHCGLIWIATKFGGLHYFDRRKQTFPLLKKGTEPTLGLSDDFVLSVAEDVDGYIWIGTKGGGLNRYNPITKTFKWYRKGNETGNIQSNRIECLQTDNSHTLWIGSEDGLISKKRNSEIFTTHAKMHVRNIYISDDKHIWIGTTNGLFRYSIEYARLNPLPTRHTDFFDVENNIGITRVFEDSKGILWIATNANGLFEYHIISDKLISHTHKSEVSHSISGNQVRAIYEDSKNRLWIGTKSDGLNLYDYASGHFIQVSTPETLPSNTIYHILEDNSGYLWLGTHNGISRFNPEDGKFISFSTHHGLQGLIFDINAHCKTKNGLLLMGGSQGLNIFNPDEITFQSYKAPLIISRFSVFNATKAIDIASPTEFVLDTRSNYLSFEIALLDYANPDENKYAYMLQPIDNDWIYAGTRNFTSYTNLAPGKYTFKVKGANSDDVWIYEGMELEITIPAPFWKKPWFVPLFIVIAIALLLIIYYLRIIASRRREAILKSEVQQRTMDLSNAYRKLEKFNRQIEKHNKTLRLQKDRISRQNLELTIHRQNLELMVVDRTRDLEEAKLKAEESDRLKSAFLANMSHEIRTPLNAIMGFIDLLEADEFDDEERTRINGIIQSNSSALLQLINDIIDISMIEANQLVIKNQNVDFHKFLNEIHTYYLTSTELKDKDVACNLSIPDETKPLIIATDPNRVKQVFTNLINNALKFTEKGHITFGYKYNTPNNQIICFVEDTGTGITEENINLLFERFRKIEPTHLKVYRGTGLGLSISKNLCELMGGDIWVESTPGKGSTFYFTLQIN